MKILQPIVLVNKRFWCLKAWKSLKLTLLVDEVCILNQPQELCFWWLSGRLHLYLGQVFCMTEGLHVLIIPLCQTVLVITVFVQFSPFIFIHIIYLETFMLISFFVMCHHKNLLVIFPLNIFDRGHHKTLVWPFSSKRVVICHHKNLVTFFLQFTCYIFVIFLREVLYVTMKT